MKISILKKTSAMSFDLRFSQVDLDVLMFEPGGTIDQGRPDLDS